MATLITHLVLSEKLFDKYFKNKNKKDFFVGTSLPDIRYLKVIEKEKTHFTVKSFKEVLNEDSFISGMKFHAFLDKIREEFIFPYEKAEFFIKSKYNITALKFFEDEMFYSKIPDWNQISSYFDGILENELLLIKDSNSVKKWHSLVTKYISVPPSDKSRMDFILGIGLTDEIGIEINNLISEMKKSLEFKKIVNRFYKEFENLCTTKNL